MEAKRIPYINPIRLYLSISLLLFLILHLAERGHNATVNIEWNGKHLLSQEVDKSDKKRVPGKPYNEPWSGQMDWLGLGDVDDHLQPSGATSRLWRWLAQ